MIDKIYIKFHSDMNIQDFCFNVQRKTNSVLEFEYSARWYNFKVRAIGHDYTMQGSLSHFYNDYVDECNEGNFYSLTYDSLCVAIGSLCSKLNVLPNEIEFYGFEFGMEVVLPHKVEDYLNLIKGCKANGKLNYKNRTIINNSTLYLHNKARHEKRWKEEYALVLYDKNKEMKANHSNKLRECSDNIMKIEMRMLYNLKARLDLESNPTLQDLTDRKFYYKLKQRFCNECYGLYGSDTKEVCIADNYKTALKCEIGGMVAEIEDRIATIKTRYPSLPSKEQSKLRCKLRACLMEYQHNTSSKSLVEELQDYIMRQMPNN